MKQYVQQENRKFVNSEHCIFYVTYATFMNVKTLYNTDAMCFFIGLLLMILQLRMVVKHYYLIYHIFVYSVRQKKVSPKVICHFLSNRWEFLHEISHIYYSFIIT